MKTYYKYYPRNFANEYLIFSVEGKDIEEFKKWREEVLNDPNRDIDRISYKQAHKDATPNEFYGGIDNFMTWYKGC